MNASVIDQSQGVTNNVSGNNSSQSIHYGPSITQNTYNIVDNLVQNLTRSHNAEYDMSISEATRGPCTPDTRTAVLQELLDWCNSETAMLYWLSGMAGTGKTTITYSICQKLSQNKQLGASFFCSRSLPDCRDVKLIIPTIAFQLARKYEPFSEALSSALRSDEYILKRDLDVQLRRLIIEPWTAKKDILPNNTVVTIEALDECNERHSDLLEAVFACVTQLPFKLLMTSRPEPSIRDTMTEKAQITGTLSTFILHEVESDLVREDIAKYLKSKLSSRVSSDDIRFLTDLAGTLFIFAATLVRFLTAKKINIAMRIKLLRTSLPPDTKLKMLALLDELYKGVLSAAFHSDLLEMEEREMKEILFTVILARTPLTRKAIGDLWNLTEEEVEDRLDALRSVISIPDGHDDPITVFHASFPDFIEDPARSQQFCFGVCVSHLELIQRCLALMKRELHQNLCQLNGRPANHTIHPDIIHRHISPGLEYASVYWSQHWMLSESFENEVILSSIQEFFTISGLHWLECLSLLRKLSISIVSLEGLQDAINKNLVELAGLVYELLRFIQQFYEPAEYSAMEIYHSALAWIPRCSPLRTHYASVCTQAPQVLYGLDADWTGPDQIIKLRSPIKAVAISRGGHFIISASQDGTVRIWNVYYRVEESALHSRIGWCDSVAISGDGSHAVLKFNNGPVEVWNVATNEALFTLQTSTCANRMNTSSDCKWIASWHDNDLVCIWDATDGRLVCSIDGKSWRQLSFMNDGIRIISMSDDTTFHIWNINTGKEEDAFRVEISALISLACSPNGDRIATCFFSGAVCLLDMSGTHVLCTRLDITQKSSMAFTADGNKVVIRSWDDTIYIWDVESGHPPHPFTTLRLNESFVAFPDGTKIASYGHDTISIWSPKRKALVGEGGGNDDGPQLKGPSMMFSANGQKMLLRSPLCILDVATLEKKNNFNCSGSHVALSALGKRVAVALGSNMIKIWELMDNDIIQSHSTLNGHTGMISSISFSHDECQLISTSFDNTARIWDVATGKRVCVLHHGEGVDSAIFSYDGIQIASTTHFTVHIWNAQSGEKPQHQFCVDIPFSTSNLTLRSIAFGPDNQHIIISDCAFDSSFSDVKICNAKTLQIERTDKDYIYWTAMSDGSFCALSKDDGWVCCFPHFGDQAQRLLWIPPRYRPTYEFTHRIVGLYVEFGSGPLFTLTPGGIQICLPREDGLVTVVIPHDA